MMVRVFAINNYYGVYVYAEANQPHHLPHCEVRWAGNSAQIALPTLTLIVGADALAPPGRLFLIFVEVAENVREARVEARDGVTSPQLARDDAHSTEAQVRTTIRAAANLVLDGTQPVSELVEQARRVLADSA